MISIHTALVAPFADFAFARLPDPFRQLCGELVIQVADFPSEDVVRETPVGPISLRVDELDGAPGTRYELTRASTLKS